MLVEMITVFVLLLLLPPIQERSHSTILVGVTVWVSQYDVNYDLSMTLP